MLFVNSLYLTRLLKVYDNSGSNIQRWSSDKRAYDDFMDY